MSRRGWIIISIVAGVVVALVGAVAGFSAYVHRVRNAAATARETFDPYYSLVQYLRSIEDTDTGADEA